METEMDAQQHCAKPPRTQRDLKNVRYRNTSSYNTSSMDENARNVLNAIYESPNARDIGLWSRIGWEAKRSSDTNTMKAKETTKRQRN